MKRIVGASFGYCRTDPAGDLQPELWHPHLNILWCQVPRMSPYIDVEALRTEWAKILGVRVVDVWSQYAKERDRGRIQHWYSYMARTWSDWQKSVPHGRRLIQLGQVPATEPYKPRCQKCFKTFRCLRVGTPEEADRLAAFPPARLDEELEWEELERERRRYEK